MRKRIIGCVLLFLVIAAFGYTAIFGVSIGGFKLPEKIGLFSDGEGVVRGLDLDGGASITFEPIIPEGYEGDVSEDVDAVVEVMRQRLTNLGYTEANVFRVGDIRIGVEIPGISNAEDAIKTLGQTAQLEFIDSENNVIMTGSDVVKATAGIDSSSTTNNYIVQLEITKDAVSKFADATERMSKKSADSNYISTKLDDKVIFKAHANERIESNTFQISGLTLDEAKEYAAVISAGRLPFALDAIEYRSIGPTLGDGALENSLLAAGIGLLIVILFMILVYRVPGVVATISLLFYIGIVALILELFHVNLSLPGIAGIILSIGMAVDANIVIYERIKEELRVGKSVGAAVKSGFNKAIIAVMDSNITTIIAAVVLYLFGTGTIQGFALTLGIGVLVSLLTSVFITKYLLNSLIVFHVENPWLYGLTKPKEKAEEKHILKIANGRKVFASVGAAIIVIGIALGIVSYTVKDFPVGLNFGIDFTGGAVFNVSLMRDVTDDDLAEVRDLLKEELNEDSPLVQKVQVSAIDTDVLHSTDIVLVKTEQNGNDFQKQFISAISQKFDLPYSESDATDESGEKVDADKITWLLSSDSVGPAAAADLLRAAVLATVIAAALMLVYIGFRFDFFSGIAAVVALLHDIAMMIIMNVVFGIQVNLSFVAAVLTILGYSINATIIIFDRIRENSKIHSDLSYVEIVNKSVRQTFKRSLFTSFTTLATIGTLYFFGVPSIKEFAFPIIVGIVCGFASSVFLSGSVWAILKNKFSKHKKSKAAI